MTIAPIVKSVSVKAAPKRAPALAASRPQLPIPAATIAPPEPVHLPSTQRAPTAARTP